MTKPDKSRKIAIIGATGNVGRKAVELLLTRLHLLPEQLELYASSASNGNLLIIAGREYVYWRQIVKCRNFIFPPR
jgi:aspartate-semialdehyde dehydrogenase